MIRAKFGVRVPNSGPLASIQNIRRVALAAEELGFNHIWVHDHTAWTFHMHAHHISSGAVEAISRKQNPDFYESLTTLAYLSGITKRVGLGVAVLVLPIKNPLTTAKQIANIDVISGGRFILGAGIGSPATVGSRDYEIAGVDRTKRGEIADEYIEAMKAIWTQDHATYRGKYIRFEDAVIFPKPVQKPHPPVLIGGWKKGAVERVAKCGDGWIPAWLTPEELAEKLDLLHERAEAYGRGRKRFIIGQEMVTCLARTDAEARRLAQPTITAGLKTYERELDVPGYMRRSLIGGPKEVARQIDDFAKVGVTDFELRPVYSSIDQLVAMMRLWAKEILPSYNRK